MNTINVYGFREMSTVDGEGVRFVIFLSGCKHNCEGCHNPEAQKYENGKPYDIFNIVDKIDELKDMHDGLTISGGEPFYNPNDLYALLKAIKNHPNLRYLNIWVYTGFKYEFLYNIDRYRRCLRMIDVLVDGKYNKDLPSGKFTGSNNQRVLERFGYSNKFIPKYKEKK